MVTVCLLFAISQSFSHSSKLKTSFKIESSGRFSEIVFLFVNLPLILRESRSEIDSSSSISAHVGTGELEMITGLVSWADARLIKVPLYWMVDLKNSTRPRGPEFTDVTIRESFAFFVHHFSRNKPQSCVLKSILSVFSAKDTNDFLGKYSFVSPNFPFFEKSEFVICIFTVMKEFTLCKVQIIMTSIKFNSHG